MSLSADYFECGLQKFALDSIIDNENISVNRCGCNADWFWIDKFLMIPTSIREAFNKGLPT